MSSETEIIHDVNSEIRLETKVQFRNNHFGNIFSIYWIFKYTTMKMFPISNNCFEPMHCVSNRISQFPNFVSYLNLG